MCRGTVEEGGSFPRPAGGQRRRLEVRAFYLRLSSSSPPSCAPAELTLVYRPAIGGAALGLAGRALPPASPIQVTLLRVRDDGADKPAAYASADRVSAADGARFEVYAAGKELAAEGVFARRQAGGGWRVECRRRLRAPHSPVAEVVVLAEGGALLRARPSAARRAVGCLTRLEGIPEEEASWGPCECGACGEGWEVVGDSDHGGDQCKEYESEEAVEMETLRWALEMGAWAVCVGVGLIATARRFSRRRALR